MNSQYLYRSKLNDDISRIKADMVNDTIMTKNAIVQQNKGMI